MCYLRQQKMASELAEANHRCQYLERDNSQLYSELAELRQSAVRASEVDEYRQRLSSAAANINQLEQLVASYDDQLKVKSAAEHEARQEMARLHEMNRHLQHELKRLQERSML